jgi:hypothetical protein
VAGRAGLACDKFCSLSRGHWGMVAFRRDSLGMPLKTQPPFRWRCMWTLDACSSSEELFASIHGGKPPSCYHVPAPRPNPSGGSCVMDARSRARFAVFPWRGALYWPSDGIVCAVLEKE